MISQQKRQTRHRQKKIDELKNQIQSRKININRLIFYESDDEQLDKNEEIKVKSLYVQPEIIKYSKKRQERRQTVEMHKAETILFRPSMMRFSSQNQSDQYQPLKKSSTARIDNYDKNSLWTKQRQRLNNQSSFENHQSQTQLNKLIFCLQCDENPTKSAQLEQTKPIEEKILKIPHLHNSNMLIFEQSQNDDKNACQIKQHLNNPQYVSEGKSPLQNIETFKIQHNHQQICQNNQYQKEIDIIKLDQKVRQNSQYFKNILEDNKNYQHIAELMFAPLRQGTKQLFKVYLSSNILLKTFELRIDCGLSMKLLMKATKNLRLQKTFYQILINLQSNNNFYQVCTLQSNIERSQYNIIKQISDNKSQMIGTVICNLSLKSHHKYNYLSLYFPKIDQQANIKSSIKSDPNCENLQKRYRKKQTNDVDYIKTSKLTADQQIMLKQYGFKKSDKSMEFENERGQLKCVIGKKRSKQYTIIAGSGISPIQIFCLSIVNIQI